MKSLTKLLMTAILSLSSVVAFADSATGVIENVGDNLGLTTEDGAFIGFNPIRGRLAKEVAACLNKESVITYHDRGMTVDLLTVNCDSGERANPAPSMCLQRENQWICFADRPYIFPDQPTCESWCRSKK